MGKTYVIRGTDTTSTPAERLSHADRKRREDNARRRETHCVVCNRPRVRRVYPICLPCHQKEVR